MGVFFFVKIPRTHLSKFSCSCQFCFNLEDGEDNPCKHNTIFDLNERIYKQNSLRKIQLLVCLLECCIFASRRCLSTFRPNPVHTVIFSSSREIHPFDLQCSLLANLEIFFLFASARCLASFSSTV